VNAGNFQFNINNSGGAGGFSGGSISAGSYNHIVASVDSGGIAKIYINGISQSVSYDSGTASQWFNDLNSDVATIGSLDRGSSGQYYDGEEIYNHTFGGSLDDEALGGVKSINGDPVIVGYTKSFGNGGEDILLIVLDQDYQP